MEPVGLIKSRKAFGVWTAIRGYEGLLGRLGALEGAILDDGTPAGYRLDATVVAVPYDFRLSIVDAAQRLHDQISQRLAHLWPDDDPKTARVVVIAHSMGGLVARYWLGQESNWERCRALITLGSPHRGAPKALDVLANGIAFGPFRITRPVKVLREWPSMAELLPRYPAVLDTTMQPSGHREALLRPHELPLEFADAARAAFAVHEEIEAGWDKIPLRGPQMVPRIGYGHGTLRSCAWDGCRVRVSKGEPAGVGLGKWSTDLGDGTVPAYSGLPLEMDRHSPTGLRVQLRHGAIADLDEVVALVESYEGRPCDLPIRGEERPVVLGFDVEELQQAGEGIEISATIAGVDADVGHVSVWACVSGAGAQPAVVEEARLEWDSVTATFGGWLVARPPGIYRVRLSAEEVPGGADLITEEIVEVLDGADVD
ncbi:MAG: esterase/lipase family protein [Pseudonocardiaceae bacterium]